MCTQPPIIFSNTRPLIDRTFNKFHATLHFSIHDTEPTKSTESNITPRGKRETNERSINSPPSPCVWDFRVVSMEWVHLVPRALHRQLVRTQRRRGRRGRRPEVEGAVHLRLHLLVLLLLVLARRPRARSLSLSVPSLASRSLSPLTFSSALRARSPSRSASARSSAPISSSSRAFAKRSSSSSYRQLPPVAGSRRLKMSLLVATTTPAASAPPRARGVKDGNRRGRGGGEAHSVYEVRGRDGGR
jgi:hypothetical protein